MDWFVLELKGADQRAFTRRGKQVLLSATANQGVCQLLTYIDAASKSQGYLRDELRLKGFREPRGVLLIGTEEETSDEACRAFKAAWNQVNPRLQIRSYSALLRVVDAKLRDFGR